MNKRVRAIIAIILAVTLNLSLVVVSSAEIGNIVSGVSDKLSLLTLEGEDTWNGTSSVAPTMTDGVYIIDSAAKLRGFADAINNGTTYQGYTVKITVNINLNGYNWTGAANGQGSNSYAFKGTLDGDNHYISNYISNDYGFFRYLNGATIKNILFKDINKSTTENGNRYAGGLCSSSRGATVINNVDYQDCYFNFTYQKSKSNYAQNGCMVGIVDDTTLTISNCDYTNVYGSSRDSRAGVLVGQIVSNTTLNVNNCKFDGSSFNQNHSDCSDIGIVVGYAEGDVNIDGITIDNGTYLNVRNGAGGLVGNLVSGKTLKMKNIVANGFTITSVSDSVGGLGGYIQGNIEIENVTFNNLTITGAAESTGGLVGYVGGTSTVSGVDITGIKITATSNDVGGILGNTVGNITMSDISINGATLQDNGTCLGTVVGYNKSGSLCNFTDITVSGNISLTNTGSDYCGDIMGNYSGNGNIYFYDINTKNAVITRNVSNRSCQAHILGYSNGNVFIDVKNETYNEIGTINLSTGGNNVGGLVGYIEGDSFTLKHTKINGTVTANASNGTNYYDYAGAAVAHVDGSCTLNDVIFTGNITVKGDERIGGIAGFVGGALTFSNVSILGTINATINNKDSGGLIGYYDENVKATFSGLNISSITINCVSGGQTLGGFVGYGVGPIDVNNCTVGSVSINSYGSNTGGLVGFMSSDRALNVTNTTLGSVSITSTNEIVGGVVGRSDGEVILDSVKINTVTLNDNTTNTGYGEVGGFIGSANRSTTITGCSIGGGTISGPYRLGGAVGIFNKSDAKLKIENYENKINLKTNLTGTTENDGYVGGVVGDINSANSAAISGCSNSGTLSSSLTTTKTKHFGGIVGRSNATTNISNCYNEGIINGNIMNGGIIGTAQGAVTVQYCYNSGNVSASSSNALSNSYISAGGIVAYVTGASVIEYCFNRGNVSAYSTSGYYVGGIVGNLNNSSAKVNNCYSTGTVTSPSTTYYRGTLIGKINSGTVQYCYTTASGSLTGGGTATNSSTITATELQHSNYVNNTQLGTVYFTSDDSNINDGYPILTWMGDPFEKNDDGIWEIWNVGHYNQFLNKVNTGSTFAGEKVYLMDNVDLGTLDTPTTIGGNGSTIYSFQGTFDGRNHSFSNFNLNNGTKTYTGFFGYVKNATIKNLTLAKFNVTGGQYTGGLVGYADGTNTFSYISIKDGITVTGGKNTGGLIGYSATVLNIDRLSSTGTIDVNCGTQSGGILGYTPESFIFDSVSLGSVDVDSTAEYVGGLVGLADGLAAASVKYIYISGIIDVATTSGSYIGGIAGRTDGDLSIGLDSSKSYISSINVSSQNGGSVGGIVGNHTDSAAINIVTNIAIGDVTAIGTGNNISALIAYSSKDVTIKDVDINDVTINASGASSCGTYVGWSKGNVTASGTNSIGNITVNATGKYISGIVGECDAGVKLSNITTGDITINSGSNTDTGAYIGNTTLTSTLSNCISKDIKIYGTGTTHGLIAFSGGNVSIVSAKFDSMTIGKETEKTSKYNGGLIGYTTGTVYINNSTNPIVTIYSSDDYNGGFIGNSSSTVTVYGSTLTTVNINGAGYGGGAVGYASTATIQNVTITNCSLNLSGNYKGGFVGYTKGAATFTGRNYLTTLSINNSDNSYVGSCIGSCNGLLKVSGITTKVPTSFFYAGVSDNNIEQIGAVAGYAASADISGFTFTSIQIGTPTARAKYYIGGFIGNVGGNLTINSCKATDIKLYTGSRFRDSSSALIGGHHSESESRTGGIVGNVGGTLTSDSITVNSLYLVAEGEMVGGFVGQVGGAADISNWKLLGDSSSISSEMLKFGGLIGSTDSKVTASDCINYASMNYDNSRAYNDKDEAFMGGIIGRVGAGDSTFTNCNNYGDIHVGITFTFTGGIVGYVSGNAVFTDCENSGDIVSLGSNVGGIIGNADGFTTMSGTNNVGSTISGTSNVGGLIGQTSNGIDFDNCSNSANITSSGSTAGGLVGNMTSANLSSTVNDCTNSGAISGGDSYTGGLFGAAKTAITDCYNTGTVNGKSQTGGIAGYMDNNYKVASSYNTASVNGTERVGGIVGFADSTSIKIESCYNSGNITSTGNYAGGITGGTKTSTGSTIAKCYNTGNVSGANYVGGVIGQSYATITESYNIGNISSTSTDAESYVGGFAGSVQGSSSMSYCYNIGDISITSAGKVGGITGTLDGTLTSCYNAGAINGANATSGYAIGYIYTTNQSALNAVYAIADPGVGSLNSGAKDAVEVVEPTVLQEFVTTDLDTNYYSAIHYFNKGYPVLKSSLDNNNHSLLDAEFALAKTCNSTDTVPEVYTNYNEKVLPIVEEIEAHGKYATQDEIDLMYAKLTAAMADLDEKLADYSALRDVLDTVPEHLYYYTSATASVVSDCIDAIVYDKKITQQSDVDEMTKNLKDAIENLELIEYTVYVQGAGSSVSYNTTKNAPYRIATVTTPSTADGKNFSYWVEVTDSGDKLVATYRNYSFYVCKDVTLKPVYGEDFTPALITSRILRVRDNNDGTTAILVEHSVSKSRSMIAHGVLFTTDASSVSDLEVGTSNDNIFDAVAAKTKTTLTGLFEVTITSSDDTLYARSYVIESDGTIHYGDLSEYDMSTLSGASIGTNTISIDEFSPIDDLQDTENKKEEIVKNNSSAILNLIMRIIQFIISLIISK